MVRQYLRSVKRTARRMRGLARRAFSKKKVATLETVEFGGGRSLVTTPQFGGQNTLELLRHCIGACDQERIRRVWNDHIMLGGAIIGAMDLFEIHVLCGLIKACHVRRVMECGPNYGWSTTFIQMALPETSEHRSYDIENFEKTIRKNVARHVPLRNWLFVLGDFRKTVTAHLDFLKEVDLLFMDSDHSASFAAWYLDEIKLLDPLKPGSLVHVHDVFPVGLEPPGFEESPYVLHWLEKHRDRYDVIFNYEVSRCHELQAELPIDLFLSQEGRQAKNPSLWLRVRDG